MAVRCHNARRPCLQRVSAFVLYSSISTSDSVSRDLAPGSVAITPQTVPTARYTTKQSAFLPSGSSRLSSFMLPIVELARMKLWPLPGFLFWLPPTLNQDFEL
ncbi:hypothetical protein HD806DRAFT_538511 [Xylariaceae sp. AK1471]|nr:hypothetical protein HD806DRAFT_538511 [Xylariaceae sp. AK1471]